MIQCRYYKKTMWKGRKEYRNKQNGVFLKNQHKLQNLENYVFPVEILMGRVYIKNTSEQTFDLKNITGSSKRSTYATIPPSLEV